MSSLRLVHSKPDPYATGYANGREDGYLLGWNDGNATRFFIGLLVGIVMGVLLMWGLGVLR